MGDGMGRRWMDRALSGAALVGMAMVGVPACGSSSTSTTNAGRATTAGTLVADLNCSGDGVAVAAAMVSNAPPTGAATAADAVHDFLTTQTSVASMRGDRFEPSRPPSSYGPVQGVTAATAVRVSTTSVARTSTPPVHVQWFVHLGPDGQVSAVVNASDTGKGWLVGTFEYCQPGVGAPRGTTQTTASTTIAGGP